MKEKIILENLDSREYEHPFDAKALDHLQQVKGFEKLTSEFYKHVQERMLTIDLKGSYLRVNEKNLKELHDRVLYGCRILSLRKVPSLFIKWDFGINALVTGINQTFMVLNSGIIDLLDAEEQMFVIGHELGHIKSDHILYHQIASYLPMLTDILGQVSMGILNFVSVPLKAALFYWYRMSEFTADRAGLLVCQNEEVALRTLMKMSGVPQKYFEKINYSEFIEQAKEFENLDYDTMNKIIKTFMVLDNTHPWLVIRASELIKWIKSGEYNKIINKHNSFKNVNFNQANNTDVSAVTSKNTYFKCIYCKRQLPSESVKFCPFCGSALQN